ncbi:MAG: hypothetical protein KA072_03470 [Thermoanaerobaculaceae bacterium]|nr:hypothetical protein [Thermoanaerobaculaceae bacterium]MDI9620854.1 hypothetical protein [Acidobacteriota bacterium]NLH11653.1 hypothetical protein [Holophagae bacterium]HPW54722.1 hypothetical protein [Thermoanaerobaculaceae bacterium]
MRGSLGLVSLLIAVAIVVFLFNHQAKKDLQAVRTVTLASSDNLDAHTFDAGAARALSDRLRSLLEAPFLPADELRRVADTAASWAAGSHSGTAEHHIATCLRSAAVELMAAGPGADDTHRVAARRHLDSAATTTTTHRSPDAVTGIRDQLQNIQNTSRQRSLETDRSLE